MVRKPTRPSLPLKKAPPLTPALSPQERGRKPPYSVLGTATLLGWRTIKGLRHGCAGWDRQIYMRLTRIVTSNHNYHTLP